MSQSVAPVVFQSTHRRADLALVMIVLMFASLGLGLSAIPWLSQAAWAIVVLFAGLAGTLVLAFGMLLVSFRVHRWTLTGEGLRIDERPKVPLTGRRRSADLGFDAIVALNRRQAGMVQQAELVTRDGRRFYLDPGHHRPGAHGIGLSDPVPFQGFLATLAERANQAGYPLTGGPVLSLWTRPLGLVFQVLLLGVALVIAGAVVWALWEGLGETTSTGGRTGWALGLLLALPLGAGYLLRASLRHRREVQRQSRG